jgi:hypothetical protein
MTNNGFYKAILKSTAYRHFYMTFVHIYMETDFFFYVTFLWQFWKVLHVGTSIWQCIYICIYTWTMTFFCFGHRGHVCGLCSCPLMPLRRVVQPRLCWFFFLSVNAGFFLFWCTCIHRYKCVCMYVCMYVYVYVYTYPCLYMYMSIRIHVYICVSIYILINIYIYIHTYIHTYVYIHTYIHTYIYM